MLRCGQQLDALQIATGCGNSCDDGAFKRLELDKKVRFLSYERIDEIDDFFSGSNSGLSVDLIVGKSGSVL